MFTQNESTGLYWLNPVSVDCDDEFRLVGVLFGLALYNNILLDVRFPLVLYRKLVGAPVSYYDLRDYDPASTFCRLLGA